MHNCLCVSLLQILELGKASSVNKDPLQTYGRLEDKASALNEELRAVREALDRASREQGYTCVRLKRDCDALERAAYSSVKQPLLRPEVRATASTAHELCPNAQVCFPYAFLILHPHPLL